MKLEDYRSELEEEIGKIVSEKEHCPGVYCIEADKGASLLEEYYVVLGGSLLQSLEGAGLEIIPPPDGKRMVGMFPGEGTDFLLLK